MVEAIHIGRIYHYNDERGYGFLRSETDNNSYFFHINEVVSGTEYIAPGADAKFVPLQIGMRLQAREVQIVVDEAAREAAAGKAKAAQSGPKQYSGETFELTDDLLQAALTEIAEWRLEAKLENISRYFMRVPEIDYVITGRKSYVIGRKGTGKTAIAQYIERSSEGDVRAVKLTFKNFPFNDLYIRQNPSFTKPNQYITIWKYIIYSYVCIELAQSPACDPKVRKRIRKAFPKNDPGNLGATLGKWSSGDLSLSIMGSGFSFSNWFRQKKDISWREKIEVLESFIKQYCSNQKFIIMFDELDEDYKNVVDNYEKNDYIDLLTSLFKAVQDVRSVFGRTEKQIFPVVFLRDDIFDLIMDSDKTKWKDLTTHLEWDLNGTRRLLNHRLSRVMNRDSDDFDKAWYTVFSPELVPYAGGRKLLRSFDYATRSTHGRPRDYIEYLKNCAESQLELGGGLIGPNAVKSADKTYSNYLRSELIDEIHGILPDISQILDIFTQIRKWILSIGEFQEIYDEFVKSGRIKDLPFDFVLKTLFYFSVIGNVSRHSKIHIFKHENPEAVLNLHENIVIHRGLIKALQIL